jgi:hypothetical protein
MARAKLALTTTTEVTTKLKVTTKALQMLTQRCAEFLDLSVKKNEIEGRMDRIKGEVQELFKKEKQTDALCDGTAVDKYKVKLVCGTGKRLNEAKLIELGCDPAWIKEATETFDKKPYIKISAPKDHGDSDEQD